MTYNANIPLSTDLISNSQTAILNNFGQLNAQYIKDHDGFNTGSGNGTGFHKKVTFVANISTPSISGAVSAIYPKAVSAVAEAYFVNSVGDSVMWRGGTGSGLVSVSGTPASPSPSGRIQFPIGSAPYTMMWGYKTVGSGTNVVTPVVFPFSGFANYCFNVQVTAVTSSPSVSANSAMAVQGPLSTSVTKTGFSVISSSSSTAAIYWFAIGN